MLGGWRGRCWVCAVWTGRSLRNRERREVGALRTEGGVCGFPELKGLKGREIRWCGVYDVAGGGYLGEKRLW